MPLPREDEIIEWHDVIVEATRGRLETYRTILTAVHQGRPWSERLHVGEAVFNDVKTAVEEIEDMILLHLTTAHHQGLRTHDSIQAGLVVHLLEADALLKARLA
jgi:hypothetical protein